MHVLRIANRYRSELFDGTISDGSGTPPNRLRRLRLARGNSFHVRHQCGRICTKECTPMEETLSTARIRMRRMADSFIAGSLLGTSGSKKDVKRTSRFIQFAVPPTSRFDTFFYLGSSRNDVERLASNTRRSCLVVEPIVRPLRETIVNDRFEGCL
jgi:hypothetical protein